MAKILTAIIDPVTWEVELDLAGIMGSHAHAVQDAFAKGLGGTLVSRECKDAGDKKSE